MGLVDAPNHVPERQRTYQHAYKAHTRIWRIHPRSKLLLTPFYVLMAGTTVASMYGMGRRIFGKTTWFD